MQVVEVTPTHVTVEIDEIVERKLEVKPTLVGTPLDGYEIEMVSVIPKSKRVKGPKSVLEALGSIQTLPIEVAGRKTSFREHVELDPQQDVVISGKDRRVIADVHIVPVGSSTNTSKASVADK